MSYKTYIDWGAGASTINTYNTSTADDNYCSFRIYDSTAGTSGVDSYYPSIVRYVHEHEELKYTTVNFDTWQYNGKKWVVPGKFDRIPHELHHFRYIHKKIQPKLGPSQNLAPLDEEIEIAPKQAIRHLRRLLKNPRYRAFQLKMINAINRRMKCKEVVYDERAIRRQLKSLGSRKRRLRELQLRNERRKQEMLKAQERADKLLRVLLPKELIIQLENERRIELIARNGSIFEVLEDGRVNKLLPDGKKQGMCISPRGGPFPVADVILTKIEMIRANPELFEEIANKRSPFPLVEVPRT